MSNQKNYPRDVFLHLLSTAALYWSVFSVLDLLFSYINIWVKDPLEYYVQPASSINWSLATLIILFPVYLWSVWFINRDLAKNPEKNEFRIRRWLLYLNVFLSAVLLIGDMVALIYGFLNGDLTVRFILKVLAVLVVGGAAFAYYFFDLRREPTKTDKLKFWRWGAAAAALIIVIVGITLVGSPFKQRLVQFDNRRISDLQTIQSQIINYWQQKNKLPAVLTDLNDSISGFMAPVDPENGQPYEYRTTGSLSFELCGTFALPSEKNVSGPGAPRAMYDTFGGNWDHNQGRTCFTRTIDPQLYGNKIPPVK